MNRAWASTSAALLCLSASTAAFAADLGYRTAVAPVYNWTGFYLGANLGGGWSSGTLTDNVTGASITGTSDGIVGGGTFGYNWQFAPNWVVGFEGTFDGSSIRRSNTAVNATYLTVPVTIQGSANSDWNTTAAARIGYAQDNLLFYAKGGAAWVDNSASITALAARPHFGWVGGTVSAGNTTAGWVAGGGVEYGLTRAWTVKAEYDYLAADRWTAPTNLAPGDSISVSHQINMFTLGVNYKF
jgi:outer membrane immunogenic protein